MARGRQITKSADEYAKDLRHKLGKGADSQIRNRIEKAQDPERKQYLKKVQKELEKLPVEKKKTTAKKEVKKAPQKRGKKVGSGKKEGRVLNEMKSQGIFTVDSILSVITDVSYGYVNSLAKKEAEIHDKEGRTVIYKIGEPKEGYVDFTFSAREIPLRDDAKDIFDRSVKKHHPVSVERAKRTDMYYYCSKQPWYHYSSAEIDEWVYWDKENRKLIRTGIQVIGTKASDLDEWEKKYQDMLKKST